MAQIEERALEEAEARGRSLAASEPRASTARYDQATGRVVLELTNGCAYAFPAELAQDLQGASPEALRDVQVDGAGFNLHWPSLEADLFVPALVSGVFGTRAWMTKAGPASRPDEVAGQGGCSSGEWCAWWTTAQERLAHATGTSSSWRQHDGRLWRIQGV